ncbi:hypothetical protein LINPERPRIM_LOCUS36294 [Linum perenne]
MGTKDNLRNCTNALLRWKRETIGVSRERVDTLKKELDSLTNIEYSESVDRKQTELVHLWRAEEAYWASRAGVKWAKFWDKNTRFFHLSTIQWRGRNSITKLKNDSYE